MKHTLKTVQFGNIETYSKKTVNDITQDTNILVSNYFENKDIDLLLNVSSGKTATINLPDLVNNIPHNTLVKITNIGLGTVSLANSLLQKDEYVILLTAFGQVITIETNVNNE